MNIDIMCSIQIAPKSVKDNNQYLAQWCPGLLTHICFSRPQSVKLDDIILKVTVLNWHLVIDD